MSECELSEEFFNIVEKTFSPMDIFKVIIQLQADEKITFKQCDYYCKRLNEILRVKCLNLRR